MELNLRETNRRRECDKNTFERSIKNLRLEDLINISVGNLYNRQMRRV